MLGFFIIIFKFISCSTSYSEEIENGSSTKKNNDIFFNNGRHYSVNLSKYENDSSSIYLCKKSSKIDSSFQPNTQQIVQGRDDGNPTYLHKKFRKFSIISQNFFIQRDEKQHNTLEINSYFNNTTSLLKPSCEIPDSSPVLNLNNEENNCLQTKSPSALTKDKTRTHNAYSIQESNKNTKCLNCNLELSNKSTNNSETKYSLKRKNISTETKICEDPLYLSVKTVQKTNFFETDPNKIFTHKESSNLMNPCQNEGKIIEYTILLKYRNFISKIECLLKEFLLHNKSAETDIKKLIYGIDLVFLPDFSSDIFGKWNIGCTDALKKVSTTADMLCKFIDFCKIDSEKKLVSYLKDCLNKNIYTSWTDEDIPDYILNEILSFLKSEESIYFKSICTELYSFVDLFDNLAIKKDGSLVNVFAVFLLMVKRNSIIIFKLKENLLSVKYQNDKRFYFIREKQNSSVLLFVFLNNLNFSPSNYIRTNIRTSILYKCISEQFDKRKQNFLHIRIVSILSNFFFHLIDFNIFFEAIKILKCKKPLSKMKNISLIVKNEIIKINQRIKDIEVNVSNNALKIAEKMDINDSFNKKIHSYFEIIIKRKNIRSQITSLNYALDFIYTFQHFKDCNIKRLIINDNTYFYSRKLRRKNLNKSLNQSTKFILD